MKQKLLNTKIFDFNVSYVNFLAIDYKFSNKDITKIEALCFDEDFDLRHFFVELNKDSKKEEVWSIFLNFLENCNEPKICFIFEANNFLNLLHSNFLKNSKVTLQRPFYFIDLSMLARRLIPSLKTYDLKNLKIFFKIKDEQNAQSDVQVLKSIIFSLLSMALNEKGKSNDGLQVLDLIEFAKGFFVLSLDYNIKDSFCFSKSLQELKNSCGSNLKFQMKYRKSLDEEESFIITPIDIKLNDSKILIKAHCYNDETVKNFLAQNILSIKKLD
jgi:hypothetical protein